MDGKPGRKTRKLATIAPSERRRPNPPPGMTGKPARQVWLRIVGAFPPDHFKPYQYDLLRSYCEASSLHKKSMQRITTEGEVITQENGIIKENPWVNVAMKASSTMISLSTKLQLTVRSTLTAHNKQPKPKPKTGREHLLFGGKKKTEE